MDERARGIHTLLTSSSIKILQMISNEHSVYIIKYVLDMYRLAVHSITYHLHFDFIKLRIILNNIMKMNSEKSI